MHLIYYTGTEVADAV